MFSFPQLDLIFLWTKQKRNTLQALNRLAARLDELVQDTGQRELFTIRADQKRATKNISGA